MKIFYTTVPDRRSTRRLDFCCDELFDALLQHRSLVIELAALTPGIFITEDEEGQPVLFCPFCGAKIEVIPQAVKSAATLVMEQMAENMLVRGLGAATITVHDDMTEDVREENSP